MDGGGKRHLAEDRISELKDKLEKISKLKHRGTEMMGRTKTKTTKKTQKTHRKCVGCKWYNIRKNVVSGEEDREMQ